LYGELGAVVGGDVGVCGVFGEAEVGEGSSGVLMAP
jgi:hypothetical protein